MNRRIYRYRLDITDAPKVELPHRAQILSVGPSRDGSDQLDLWALVDPDNELRVMEFRIVGTGNPMPDDYGTFIGTVAIHGGALVWHVFTAARR
jgi:hypothetical protein